MVNFSKEMTFARWTISRRVKLSYQNDIPSSQKLQIESFKNKIEPNLLKTQKKKRRTKNQFIQSQDSPITSGRGEDQLVNSTKKLKIPTQQSQRKNTGAERISSRQGDLVERKLKASISIDSTEETWGRRSEGRKRLREKQKICRERKCNVSKLKLK